MRPPNPGPVQHRHIPDLRKEKKKKNENILQNSLTPKIGTKGSQEATPRAVTCSKLRDCGGRSVPRPGDRT